MIPTQPLDGGDLRYSVSIDGQEPVVYSLKEEYRSERWKTNVMRGQACGQRISDCRPAATRSSLRPSTTTSLLTNG
jgi:hypothetical protein